MLTFHQVYFSLEPNYESLVRKTPRRPKPWSDLSRSTKKLKTKEVFESIGKLAEDLSIGIIDLVAFFGDWAASIECKPRVASQFRMVGEEDFKASVPLAPAVSLQTTLNLSVHQYKEIRLFCKGFGLTFPTYPEVKGYVSDVTGGEGLVICVLEKGFCEN